MLYYIILYYSMLSYIKYIYICIYIYILYTYIYLCVCAGYVTECIVYIYTNIHNHWLQIAPQAWQRVPGWHWAGCGGRSRRTSVTWSGWLQWVASSPHQKSGCWLQKKRTHFENNEPRVEKLDRPKLKNWMNQLNHLILGAKWTLNRPPKVGIDHP